MLPTQYDSISHADVDLVREFSTVPRATIHGEDDVESQFSVKYRPYEFVTELVDEEWDDHDYRVPIETTVMVVDEDEIINREAIAESRNLSNVR